MRSLDKRVVLRRKKTYNTRSNKWKPVRTPGGRLVVQYLKRVAKPKRNPHHLGGAIIQGVKPLRPMQRKKAPKNQLTVCRAYGGNLTYDLVRDKILRAFLNQEQAFVKAIRKEMKKKEKKQEK
eukprot:NODE_7687_length_443_cov_29.522843_g6842_i0.p1 GENE.NODE_7687_length_443_cov_29.522843_g6842_i0~~NODE_7687_length_443_cov_29.522843_g6842_i0.p1  ORF type:complete len:139 (-),score=24.31 NODE_7687_length_443_cov_29.522843_g6842_i0:27-395(-)